MFEFLFMVFSFGGFITACILSDYFSKEEKLKRNLQIGDVFVKKPDVEWQLTEIKTEHIHIIDISKDKKVVKYIRENESKICQKNVWDLANNYTKVVK